MRRPSSASDSGGTVRAAPGSRAACLRTAPQMDIWRRVRIPRGAHPGDCQVGSAPGLRRAGTCGDPASAPPPRGPLRAASPCLRHLPSASLRRIGFGANGRAPRTRTSRLHAPRLGRSTSRRRVTRIRGPAHASPSARPCASWRRRRGRKDFSPTSLKSPGTSLVAHLLRWIVKGIADERRSHLQGGRSFHRPH